MSLTHVSSAVTNIQTFIFAIVMALEVSSSWSGSVFMMSLHPISATSAYLLLPYQVVSICNLQRLALCWFHTPGLQLDNEWKVKFRSQWTSHMEPSAISTMVTGPVVECLQAGTEDVPVLDHPAALRHLRASGAGYKYSELLYFTYCCRKSLPGLFVECRSAASGTNSQTEPTNMSTPVHVLLLFTPTITI